MVDPDAKYNGSHTEILHWIQQDLTYSPSMSNASIYPLITAANSTAVAPYVSPAPPAELPPRAHRYTLLLFKQSANFTVPSAFATIVQTRVGFDLVKFVADVGLGPVIAADYFLAMNTSVAGVTSGSAGVGSKSMSSLIIVGGLVWGLLLLL